MQTKDQMSEPDFQRLVQIALTDLAIRRTVAENDMADVNEEMRSLEKDDNWIGWTLKFGQFNRIMITTGSF
ncbi:hypothetical protein [Secundilactobacillus kimchicus]|uniref:hypothetical protein n=1 Tax=Secundilactobacillus kimchicus TaxID=528209 RepID=UPI0024A93DBE|nr:hypothetical protein [Secundilactobacillus kimchicus]